MHVPQKSSEFKLELFVLRSELSGAVVSTFVPDVDMAMAERLVLFVESETQRKPDLPDSAVWQV